MAAHLQCPRIGLPPRKSWGCSNARPACTRLQAGNGTVFVCCADFQHRQLQLNQLAFPKEPDQGAVVVIVEQVSAPQALDLAKRALGKTEPNPAVGCVLVKDGQVVGEGFHPKAGMPHAEVYALRGAGTNARNATAYVTLEPCNHYGRTPPCSRALVEAGVQRVVVGVGDPNPLVASEGIATLESAGIEVTVMDGEERQMCLDLNPEFMERMRAEAQKGAHTH